jgi:hypothetical protein
MNGHAADMPMEVFSAGTADLDQLVLFVLGVHQTVRGPCQVRLSRAPARLPTLARITE